MTLGKHAHIWIINERPIKTRRAIELSRLSRGNQTNVNTETMILERLKTSAVAADDLKSKRKRCLFFFFYVDYDNDNDNNNIVILTITIIICIIFTKRLHLPPRNNNNDSKVRMWKLCFSKIKTKKTKRIFYPKALRKM